MGGTWRACGRKMYTPKKRIRRKVEKPEYRQRYELRVGGRAVYNLHGKLVGVASLTPDVK